MKTKPTQHSVKELRSIGLQPDVLICRSEHPVPRSAVSKIALFTNVEERAVVSLLDANTIYVVPQLLQEQGLDDFVVEKFGLTCPPSNLENWANVVDAQLNPDRTTKIAIVGKYLELLDAYKSLVEAVGHAGIRTRTRVEIEYIDAQSLEENGVEILANVDAILVPGGFGKRGFEGKILAAKYARENNVPYLGICYGLHAAVIDYARHVAGLTNAHSTEIDESTPHPVIGLITEWMDSEGQIEQRQGDGDLGGTMRLGEQACVLEPGSKAAEVYGAQVVRERHRHRYEVNNTYIDKLASLGLRVAGRSEDAELVEMIELPNHPWFLACQFHPEFTSTPLEGHPMFIGFVEAALFFRDKAGSQDTNKSDDTGTAGADSHAAG